MLRVIECFAKSLKVTQDHFETTFVSILVVGLCLYLVPFLSHSASNSGLTLKSGFGSFKVSENGAVR